MVVEDTCLGQLWEGGESLSEGTVIALVTGLEKGQFGGRAIAVDGSTGQDKQNGKNPEPCSLQTRSLGAQCLRSVFFVAISGSGRTSGWYLLGMS